MHRGAQRVAGGGAVKVSLSQVKPNPRQPRKNFDGLEGLAASIRERGLLEPLMVRPKGKAYEIIHGERRWRACKLAGVTEVEVIVREASDEEAFELALVENLQRQDLNPIEEAQAFAGLIEAAGWTQERVASLIGRTQQYVASRMVLLRLPAPVQEKITTRVVTASHGEVLAGLKDPKEQVRLAERIEEERLSVRALREETAGTGGAIGFIHERSVELRQIAGWVFTKPGPDGALRAVEAPSGAKAFFYRTSLQFDESGGEWDKLDLMTLGFLIPWPHKGQEDPEAWWWGDWSNYVEAKGFGSVREQIKSLGEIAEGLDFLLGLGIYADIGPHTCDPLLVEMANTQLNPERYPLTRGAASRARAQNEKARSRGPSAAPGLEKQGATG